MLNCAKAAAEMASSANANSGKRMERMILIVIPFCPMILRVPGEAVLLRAAPMERDDFPDETYFWTLPRLRMILIETFSRSRSRSLSKTAQFGTISLTPTQKKGRRESGLRVHA